MRGRASTCAWPIPGQIRKSATVQSARQGGRRGRPEQRQHRPLDESGSATGFLDPRRLRVSQVDEEEERATRDLLGAQWAPTNGRELSERRGEIDRVERFQCVKLRPTDGGETMRVLLRIDAAPADLALCVR